MWTPAACRGWDSGSLAGFRKPLDPATLESEEGRLYCRVRRGEHRARFGRLAMQQLAPYLEESAGRVTLVLGGARHAIVDARAATGELRVG